MSAVTTIGSLFSGCTSLASVPADLFKGMTAIKTMSSVFKDCTALTAVPEDIFAEVTAVITVNSMFSGCTNLKSCPVDFFDNMKQITNVGNLFNGCSSLTGESPYTTVNGVKYHLYERTGENEAASGLKALGTATSNRKGCFAGCTGLSDYDSIPAEWK